MADQSELVSWRVQLIHYLSQSRLEGRFPPFSVAKLTRLVVYHFYSYLRMVYKFVIKAHGSSHTRRHFAKKKTHFDSYTFKCLSCELLTRYIRLLSWNVSLCLLLFVSDKQTIIQNRVKQMMVVSRVRLSSFLNRPRFLCTWRQVKLVLRTKKCVNSCTNCWQNFPQVQTTLSVVEEERDRFMTKLLNEEKSRKELEGMSQQLEFDMHHYLFSLNTINLFSPQSNFRSWSMTSCWWKVTRTTWRSSTRPCSRRMTSWLRCTSRRRTLCSSK